MSSFYNDSYMEESSDNGGKDKKQTKTKGNQTYRPFTIKQIKKAETSGDNNTTYYIYDKEITLITIVGVVRSVTRQDTNTSYVVEDGTGAIDVVRWETDINQANIMSDGPTITSDTYVRVSGRIHSFNTRVSNISAAHIEAISDFNEITYHFLDVIYTYFNIGKLDVISMMSGVKKGGNQKQNNQNLVKRAIAEFSHTSIGALIVEVAAHLKDHLSENQVLIIINDMKDNGIAFNTCGEEYIRLAE